MHVIHGKQLEKQLEITLVEGTRVSWKNILNTFIQVKPIVGCLMFHSPFFEALVIWD